MERIGSNNSKGEIDMIAETHLDDVIQELTEKLEGMEPGTDEYKATSDYLLKLMDRSIEIGKFNHEVADKAVTRKEERRDRFVKNFLSFMNIAVPAGLTVWGTIKSLTFEEKGTVTTIVGRGFINKLLPKK